MPGQRGLEDYAETVAPQTPEPQPVPDTVSEDAESDANVPGPHGNEEPLTPEVQLVSRATEYNHLDDVAHQPATFERRWPIVDKIRTSTAWAWTSKTTAG